MDILQIWGNKEAIEPLEIAERTVVMFAYMLLLLRITGMRPFSKGDPFDSVLSVLFGAVLARGIVGATPFVSAMAAGAVMIGLHFLCVKLSFYKSFGFVLKGHPIVLYKEGRFDKDNMHKTGITEHDVIEDLRINLHQEDFTGIKEIRIERTGKLSFIKASS